jgi:hypothetical protein
MAVKSSNQSQKIEESKIAPRVAPKSKYFSGLMYILAQEKSKIVQKPLVVTVEPDKGPLPKKATSAYIYFNKECYENAR